MHYLSVCSGIEAASVAWEPLGWTPSGFCEIEPFPRAVLAHRFPGVLDHGDFTRIARDPGHSARQRPVDLLVGGTPCQAFSLAGLRGGLSDARGQLALEFCRLVGVLRPRWVLWENVPGALSADGGRALGAILGALGQLGYGWSYRVLDAQYVRVDGYARAVPQRRQRVFVVGCAGGEWQRAAAVLLEPEGVFGDSPPRRETREEAASKAGGSAQEAGGGRWPAEVAPTLYAAMGEKWGIEDQHIDGGAGHFIHEPVGLQDTAMGAALEVEAYQQHGSDVGRMGVLRRGRGDVQSGVPFLPQAGRVRRLTPRECERLQGFPDGWTAVPWRGKDASRCPDGPRYKAIGNSMAVNVMRWIGRRVEKIDGLSSRQLRGRDAADVLARLRARRRG